MTTTKFYRHPGEGAARPEKEKGTTPFEIAPGNDTGNSTVEPSRETARERQARAAAINAKRHQGGIGLIDAAAWVAFGAWAAAVILWLAEVL